MRKYKGWLVGGMVLLILTACGGGSTPEASSEQTETIVAPAADSQPGLANR